ncbi:MAG TPA: ABC transporter ATP-binding protein [Treponemataceae bacterium]|nr:ABC transporter ATP-binding protein [Treponemataceae bacterium]
MISVSGLSFSYTKKPFITNMSFNVSKGEIFGFLGPSGAGKSTVQKILTGMLTSFTGNVSVLNTDIKHIEKSFYEKIGVDFEFSSLFEKMTARENLRFFSSLYSSPSADIEGLLKKVDLHKDADKKVSAFSKGMKSRLNFIKALVHDPDLIFLDEPTSGLDPSNAAVMKQLIIKQKNLGKTIILTTHNMYDASELCGRVAFIVDGSIKALDSPWNLMHKNTNFNVVYSWLENGEKKERTVPVTQTSSDEKLQSLIKQNALISIHSCEPNLNDVFAEITGRVLV